MINFFSIVLNGIPYVPIQYQNLCKLDVPWHWHIIEGVAALAHCGSWGDMRKRFIPDWCHKEYLSIDGTKEYLDNINDDRLTVYRINRLWDGKVEMVNVFLPKIQESLLWELDIDEFYSKDQIEGVYRLFNEKDSLESCLWWTYFFVGPRLICLGENCWSNQNDEWRRIWKFRPGMYFSRHEPPILMENERIVGEKSYNQQFMGLNFGKWQHFAYATEPQIRFKRDYYGAGEDYYQGWLRMQQKPNYYFPCKMHFAMGIGGDSPMVDHLDHYPEIVPLVNF